MLNKNKNKNNKFKWTALNVIAYITGLFNNNKLIAGLFILLVNIGSKYVTIEFSKTQEEYLRNILSRQLIVFAILWTATRDLIISILLTAAFVILSDFIINPESDYCMLPNKYKHMHMLEKQGHLNDDKLVTKNDIKMAKKVLEKAKLQEHKINYLEHINEQ